MKARDILTSNVITVGLDTPLPEVADLLVRHRIGSLPVLDADGAVAGIVSEDDFLRRVETGTHRRLSRLAEFFSSDKALQQDYVRSRAQRARDAMRTHLPHVTPDTELGEIVNVLEHHNIHSVVVLEAGKLAGIVSRSDLVRAFASAAHAESPPSEDDRAIRETLCAELTAQPWGGRFENTVVVIEGVVHLWGSVCSDTERAALRVAAESVRGVCGVEDHTVMRVVAPRG